MAAISSVGEKLKTLISFIKGEVHEYAETKEATVEIAVDETVVKILNAIIKKPSITQKKLAEITGLSRRGIEWNIAKLKSENKIVRVGSDKKGYWMVK
jgi:ATP-dependent DNA helicase RecG